MPRHNLYEINLERLTAFCTVCGNTDIVVYKTHEGSVRKIVCRTRDQEMREKRQEKRALAHEERKNQLVWKERHILSEIDPGKSTAVCSVCGPTDIWRIANRYKGKTYYMCGMKYRADMRNYKRAHYEGRPSNPHALSQIDDDAGTAVCATCGPVEIERQLVNKYVMRRCKNAIKPKRSRKT